MKSRASDPFPPLAKGGAGGVVRDPWKSKPILLASREGCERSERERAWEDLVTGRAGATPLPPLPNRDGHCLGRRQDLPHRPAEAGQAAQFRRAGPLGDGKMSWKRS